MEDNGILAIIGVSVGITAFSSDGGCGTGISITFSIDIIIMVGSYSPSNSGVESYSPYNSGKVNDVSKPKIQSNQEFLNEEEDVLKQLYDIWSSYIDRYKEDLRTRIIHSMDELSVELKKIVEEQCRIRALIENRIFDIDSFLERKTLNEDELKKAYVLLSNAYQLIRDLSMTFCLGDMSLRNSIDCSEKAESIAEKWLSKTANEELLSLIKARRDYSRRIDELTNSIINSGNDYTEYARKLKTIEENIKTLGEKLNRIEVVSSSEQNPDDIESERNHINSILATKEARLEKYESEKRSLQKDISNVGAFGFGKKKKFEKRLAEVEIEINKLNIDIGSYKNKLNDNMLNQQENTHSREIDEIKEQIKRDKEESDNIASRMNECKIDIENWSNEINEVLAKYETVVKELADNKGE